MLETCYTVHQKFCQSFSAPKNDKNVSETQWKSYNRKVETKTKQNIYNLFKMATFDSDTLTKALGPVVDRFTNSVDRKVFNCFCDSFLNPINRFVRFCAGNLLELCPERIIRRIQVWTTTHLVRSDGTWQIALKPGLSCSSLMDWCGILLKIQLLSLNIFVFNGLTASSNICWYIRADVFNLAHKNGCQ